MKDLNEFEQIIQMRDLKKKKEVCVTRKKNTRFFVIPENIASTCAISGLAFFFSRFLRRRRRRLLALIILAVLCIIDNEEDA